MKNKVFNLSYSDFTLNKRVITIPQNFLDFNPLTSNYDKVIEYQPEVMRITNSSDVTLMYNIFENEKELDDYNRDPSNLFDHLDINSGKRDVLRNLSKNKFCNIIVTGNFTGFIKVEFIDYKFKS